MLVTGRLEVREYETNDGEKRQSVEVIADEIGPSLRWATATIARTERRTPDGGGNYSPQSTPAPAGPGPDFDEEPF